MEDPPPPTAAWPPPNPAISAAIAAPDPLSRYRALQVISIVLIVGGLFGLLVSVLLGGGFALENAGKVPSGRAVLVVLGLVLSGLAVVAGAVMNAVRAVIVRGALPASRYRGPSILVLLLLAFVLTSIGAVGAFNDLMALGTGDPLSVGGSLLLLTITQVSLLVIAGIFVVAPRALEGVHLLPTRRGVRTFLLGLGVAVPAWIGANLVGLIMTLILGLFGRQPEPGIVEDAIAQVDPTVLVLAIVIVAPVAEEVFFRGIVYSAWLREHGPRVALYGSAALFAVIHANTVSADALIASVVTVVPIFMLGIALALVYRLTGSLPAAIGLHAGFNGITVALALLVRLGVLDIPLTP